jgi:hypothetical protein
VHFRIRARRRLSSSWQVLVALHVLARTRAIVSCRFLLHGFQSLPPESSPSI